MSGSASSALPPADVVSVSKATSSQRLRTSILPPAEAVSVSKTKVSGSASSALARAEAVSVSGATSSRRLRTSILLIGLVCHPAGLKNMSDVEERDQERINNLLQEFDQVFTVAQHSTHADCNFHIDAVVGRNGAKKVAQHLQTRGIVIQRVMIEHIRMFNGYYQKLVMPGTGAALEFFLCQLMADNVLAEASRPCLHVALACMSPLIDTGRTPMQLQSRA